MRVLLVAAVVATSSQSGPEQQPKPQPDAQPIRVKEYRAPHCATPPTLDGALDDATWAQAPWTSDFVDIEGSAKPTPRYRTRAKMLWDETHFYIAAELEEPDVWATLTKHDEIVFRDNDFEVFIDPNDDTREYYELEVNALGTIFDLFLPRTYIEGGPAVHSWNCAGLTTRIAVAGTLNDSRDADQRWTLEWAIPWSSLTPPARDDTGAALPPSPAEAARGARPPSPGDTWRVNFSRVQWRHTFEPLDAGGRRAATTERPATNAPYRKVEGTKEDNWVWSPQGVIDMHRPERWGKVTFVRESAESSPPPPAPPTTVPAPSAPRSSLQE